MKKKKEEKIEILCSWII